VTSEARQASIYNQLVRHVVCDPDVAQVNFFGYYDERDRGGWQSALRRLDGTERASHAAVTAAIAATGGTCNGFLRWWQPQRRPLGAAVSFLPTKRVQAKTHNLFEFRVRVTEDVSMKAGLVPAGTPASLIPDLLGGNRATLAYTKEPKSFVVVPQRAGRVVLAVLLTAKMNPTRAALFQSPAFAVGPAPLRPRDPIRYGVR
jgi:hypothetical protein